MDVSFDQLMQFGVPLVILAFVGLGIWRACAWLGPKAVLPLCNSGVDYFNKQTEATQKSVESLEQLTILETDIRRSIAELQLQHADKDSCFSTIHTNASLKILAKAVQRVATAVNCDVDELIAELEKTLNKQDS